MPDVFVYGTLKPGAVNDWVWGQFVTTAYPAIAYGELYALPFGYPAMTLGDRPVQGYLLKADSAALPILDDFEQHDPVTFRQRLPHLQVEENQYQRQLIQVWSDRYELLGEAWAYLMTHAQVKRLGGVYLPAGIWNDQQP